MSNAVALFAKAPVPGDAKTRLAPVLGVSAAAELYRCFLLDAVELVKRVPNCDKFVFGSPLDRLQSLREILDPSIPLLPQAEGDLGERMNLACGDLFARGYTSVVIIGSDLPTLPVSRLVDAFAALEHKQVVVGPSMDGGYHLIGLTRPRPELFEQIEWGTRQVLVQTLDQIESLGLTVECLEPWYDVDTPDDLDFLVSHLRILTVAGSSEPPSHTLSWLVDSGRLVCRQP